MKRPSYILALVLPIALAGCENLMFGEVDDILLRTGRSVYAAGDTVALRLTNDSHETIGYNLCAHLVQQRVDDRWLDTLYGHDGPCFAMWYRLRHDETDTYPAALDADIPPGTYRFRTRVDTGSDGEHSVYSRSFEVE